MPKRDIRSFEADEDVGKLLNEIKAAGIPYGKLVNDAVRAFLLQEADKLRDALGVVIARNSRSSEPAQGKPPDVPKGQKQK